MHRKKLVYLFLLFSLDLGLSQNPFPRFGPKMNTNVAFNTNTTTSRKKLKIGIQVYQTKKQTKETTLHQQARTAHAKRSHTKPDYVSNNESQIQK